MVLEIWSDPDITAKTGYEYTRAIQFQCLGRVDLHKKKHLKTHKIKQTEPGLLPKMEPAGSERDGITFTGINFLSRVPIVEHASAALGVPSNPSTHRPYRPRPSMIQEMFVRARALGLEPYGSNDGKPRKFSLNQTGTGSRQFEKGNCWCWRCAKVCIKKLWQLNLVRHAYCLGLWR